MTPRSPKPLIATDPRWRPLALSAQAAWRWAWATATARTWATEPTGVLVDEQAEQILEYARTAMPPSSDGLVTLPMLFGALLETTNVAPTALRTELGNRGVDVEPVLKSCREHLGTRTSYADYLRDHAA